MTSTATAPAATSTTGGDCLFGWTVDRNNNRINSLASYDSSGNVEVLGPRRYSYDALNMMTLDQASAFVYTADDERIATYKSDTGEWHWTLRDMGNKVLRQFKSKDNGTSIGTSDWTWVRDYVWRDNLLLASRQHDGTATTTFHYHLDHLGTPRRITDQKDAIVGFHDYLAFGREKSGKNEIPLADLKYTGHERDLDVTGQHSLDYMHARFYNAAAGRFLSTDPELDQKIASENPQLWNRYAYVSNKPLSAVDPTGRVIKAVFDMSDGTLTITDVEKNKTIVIKNVFSGSGPHQNNPRSGWVKDDGPVPLGKYLIGKGYPHAGSYRRQSVVPAIWQRRQRRVPGSHARNESDRTERAGSLANDDEHPHRPEQHRLRDHPPPMWVTRTSTIPRASSTTS